MISNAILYLVYVWLSGIAGLITAAGFSDVVPNTSIVSGVSTAGGYLHVAYNVMPGTTVVLLACVVLLLVFEGGLASYKLIKWGYQKIPGIT